MLLLFFLPLLVAGHGGRSTAFKMHGVTTYLSACSGLLTEEAAFCTREQADTYYDYGCGCVNVNYLATMTGCIEVGKINKKAAYTKYIQYCMEEYQIPITYENLLIAQDRYEKLAKNTKDIEDFDLETPVDIPIKVDLRRLKIYMRAWKISDGNFDVSFYYGVGILGYWLLILTVATIANWSMILFPTLTQKCTGPFSNAWRKYVTLPALGRRKKTNEQKFLWLFDYIVPSRFETVVLVGFCALTTVACAVGITWFEGNPVDEQRGVALSRYLGDRTGIVVTVYMPLVILFAGRNNFLQYLTHWSFATFLTYHRWVARVAFILVFIHSVCYTIADKDRLPEEYKEKFMIWGIVGTVAGSLIMFQGLLALRRRCYEVFLAIHIILAALFIGGSWIHVVEYGYAWFYYAATAVWAFDRLIRIMRLISFGCPKAQVILLADETLKVIVPRPKYWHPVPGGHAFIHFMRPSCFWQSHPFTFTQSVEHGDSVVLYCKVKGGITHGLYQYLAKHPGQTTQIRVSLEGPYGEPTAVSKYSTAVFVAGGNGIPGIYSEVFDLARRSPDNIKQVLKLVWIVREYKSLYWFYEELVALKNTKIQTTVYITNPDSHAHLDDFHKRFPLVEESESDTQSKKDEKSGSLQEKSYNKIDVSDNNSSNLSPEEDYAAKKRIIETIHSELSHVEFKVGRPSMEKLVEEETKESTGSISFITCGHPLMVDDLRYSVVKNLDKSEGKRIEFFEQLQVWA